MILSHNLLYHTKVVINLNSSLVSLVLPISLILQIPNPFFFLASDPYLLLHCKQPKHYCLTHSFTVFILCNMTAEPDFTPAFLIW